MIVRHYPIARPLPGLSQAPSTPREIRSHRRLHQLGHFYRRVEPTLAAIAFAALVLVVWHAGVVLVRAVAGLL